MGGGVKCDLQSGLLPVYDCSDSEAITAGRTASICLSVYVRQHKRHPGSLFIFSLFSLLSPPHNSLTFLYGRIFSPPLYLKQCQGVHIIFLLSFHSHILYVSPPSPRHILPSPLCVSCRGEIQFNHRADADTDLTGGARQQNLEHFSFKKE